MRFSCSPDWGILIPRTISLKAPQQILSLWILIRCLGSFAGLATAEKVVTVSEITKADYALLHSWRPWVYKRYP